MDPGPDTLPPFMSVLNFVEARTVTREDWAAYAQIRFGLSDRLSLIAGGRYQSEDQLDEAVQFFFIPSSQRTDDTKFTWKLGLDYSATENNMLYGLVSTGWKNGGTNPGALNGAIDVPVAFQPAEVIAYEIGTVIGPIRVQGKDAETVTFHFMAMWRRQADGSWRILSFVGQPD